MPGQQGREALVAVVTRLQLEQDGRPTVVPGALLESSEQDRLADAAQSDQPQVRRYAGSGCQRRSESTDLGFTAREVRRL